jgi:hypothetical protein
MMNATLLDDDGVLIVASLSGLRARYVRPGSFYYAFPRELLACMNSGVAFGWRAGGEGEHSVAVERLDEAPKAPRRGAISGSIVVAANDTVLVVPYSTFSFECDGDVTFGSRGRLAAEIALPEGTYQLDVLRRDGGEGGGVFDIRLWSGKTTPVKVNELPGWT